MTQFQFVKLVRAYIQELSVERAIFRNGGTITASAAGRNIVAENESHQDFVIRASLDICT